MARKVRLAAACSVVLATAFAASVRAEPVAPAPGAGLNPGLLLGGARTVAVDLLWLRADLRRTQGHTLELPALYSLIAELDPKNPLAWQFHADVLIANLPLTAAGDPDGGWRYYRAGLELLQRGLEHDPDSQALEFNLGLRLVHLVTDRPPEWRQRATELLGADPAVSAAERLTAVWQRADAEPRIGFVLKHALLLLAEDFTAGGDAATAAQLTERAAAVQARLDALGEGALPEHDDATHHNSHDH